MPSPADDADFHASAVTAKCHQRSHSAVEEIGELNFFTRLMQDLVLRQIRWDQVEAQQLVLFIGKRQEDYIAHCLPGSIGASAGMQGCALHRP